MKNYITRKMAAIASSDIHINPLVNLGIEETAYETRGTDLLWISLIAAQPRSQMYFEIETLVGEFLN